MSIDFNGTTSVLNWPVTATLRPVLPVTLACWVNVALQVSGVITSNKVNSTHRGAWINIESTGGDIGIGFGDNGGNTAADRRSKLTVSPNVVTAGVWYHLCGTIRGAGDITIYINGVDAGGDYSGSGGGQVYNSSVGGRCGAASAFTDGMVADGAFWNVSLSAAEVLSMAKGVPAKMVRPGSLLVNYPMWNASDPSIDLSANSLESATMVAAAAANHGPVGCPFPVAV